MSAATSDLKSAFATENREAVRAMIWAEYQTIIDHYLTPWTKTGDVFSDIYDASDAVRYVSDKVGAAKTAVEHLLSSFLKSTTKGNDDILKQRWDGGKAVFFDEGTLDTASDEVTTATESSGSPLAVVYFCDPRNGDATTLRRVEGQREIFCPNLGVFASQFRESILALLCEYIQDKMLNMGDTIPVAPNPVLQLNWLSVYDDAYAKAIDGGRSPKDTIVHPTIMKAGVQPPISKVRASYPGMPIMDAARKVMSQLGTIQARKLRGHN